MTNLSADIDDDILFASPHGIAKRMEKGKTANLNIGKRPPVNHRACRWKHKPLKEIVLKTHHGSLAELPSPPEPTVALSPPGTPSRAAINLVARVSSSTSYGILTYRYLFSTAYGNCFTERDGSTWSSLE